MCYRKFYHQPQISLCTRQWPEWLWRCHGSMFIKRTWYPWTWLSNSVSAALGELPHCYKCLHCSRCPYCYGCSHCYGFPHCYGCPHCYGFPHWYGCPHCYRCPTAMGAPIAPGAPPPPLLRMPLLLLLSYSLAYKEQGCGHSDCPLSMLWHKINSGVMPIVIYRKFNSRQPKRKTRSTNEMPSIKSAIWNTPVTGS